MKKIIALLLALTFIFTLSACVKDGADDKGKVETSDADYIMGKNELVIGITYFAPMNYFDDNNKLVGFETEFAEAVCAELGIRAKFQEISWAAKETELKAKNIDCIWNGMTVDAEREKAMSISQHYMKNRQVLVMKAERAEGIENAAGLNVVAEKVSAGESVILTNKFFDYEDCGYIPVDTQTKAITEVKSGTADACVVDYVTSIGMIGEGTDFEDLVVVETEEFNSEEYGIAFRKNSDMTEKVNEAINALINNGKLMEIAKKYQLEDQIIIK